MEVKMRRFLMSLGLTDPDHFDLSFDFVKRDASDGNKVNMSIRKETPWTSSDLEDFKAALATATYNYSLRFAYSQEPSFQNLDDLFEGWYLSVYHGIPPFALKESQPGLVVAEMPSNEKKGDMQAILKDFRALVKWLNYPFEVQEQGEMVAPEGIKESPSIPDEASSSEDAEPSSEDIAEAQGDYDDKVADGASDEVSVSEESASEGACEDSDAPEEPSEEEKAHQEAIAQAAQDYIKSLQEAKQNSRYDAANRRGNYLTLHSLNELATLPGGNVCFDGQIYEYSDKLGRKGGVIANFGVGDDDNAISVKAFESKAGVTAEILSHLAVGVNVEIKGAVDFDRFTGEKYVMAHYIDVMPPKPLRTDPYPGQKRVELHLHSKLSAMDGVGEISDYCALAKNMGMSAIAVTDHGNIQAFPTLQNEAKKNGLKAIYGCEFYMFDPLPRYVFNPSPIKLSKAKYCVFDFETTGLSAVYDRITEFGGVIVENGAITNELDEMVNPEVHIPEKIQAKTHITDDMVKNADKIGVAIQKISAFIGDAILVSHNASFDFGFLNESRKRCGLPPLTNPVIDTLALSHYLFPEAARHNLGSLTKNLGLTTYNEDEAHRANFDAAALNSVWQVILPRIDPKGTLSHADLANLSFNSETYPDLSPEELDKKRSEFFKHIRPSHMIALVKNPQGLKDMYRLISLSNTLYLSDLPKIPKSELALYRSNLLFGSACFNSDVFEIAETRSYEELKEVMKFYDYVELQPVENYSYLLNIGDLDEGRLMEILKTIVRAADELGKPIVATGDCHYVNPEDKVCRDVYIMAKALGNGRHPLNPTFREHLPAFANPDQHLRSTQEMMDSFKKWLPLDKCEEIIIKNSNAIADQIEPVEPVKPDVYAPNANLPNSAGKIHDLCYSKLFEVFGPNPDPQVKQRLDDELEGIIKHGYAVTYYIAHCIIKKANEDGYFVGSRGSVGSSFAATMASITEVNPLAPFYLCPKCKHFEWNKDPKYKSGFDLPEKLCPDCGTPMIHDGQNIPFQTFLGFNAEKVPDIDLNFPPDYQAKAHDYTRQLLGARNVFRAGTIETVAEKTAYGYVRGYYEKMGKDPDKDVSRAQIAKLASKCTGVKRTTGQHPGGIVVIPADMDVFDFTPYQHPANDLGSDWLTTHYEFASMHDEVLKLDLLGHVDPLALRLMALSTGVDIFTIPMNDPEVLSLFTSPKALKMNANPLKFATGAMGLPEFGTEFVQGLLEGAKPRTFNDLLIVSGLSHGTNVWGNNAEDLIKNKVCSLQEVIGCRDDIMNDLISYGIDNSKSFKIMEYVRKNKIGKPLKQEDIDEMKKHEVPDYFIESCKKIRYLFPRAHATAYVMGALRVAWFKVHRPLQFYAVYFTVRVDAWDIPSAVAGLPTVYQKIAEYDELFKNKAKKVSPKDQEIYKYLLVVSEMLERGYKMSNVDIYRSLGSDFVVDEEKKMLIPPFKIIDGLGAAGDSVVEARKHGTFLSKEDLHDRTQLSTSDIENLSKIGALDGLGETNQMSLFEF
jgi:DNA polymerase-3 subunit alpha (Gram-positive type)